MMKMDQKSLPTVTLSLLRKEHADALFQLVDENRDYLRRWLPWVDANRSVADTESFLEGVVEQHRAGKGPQYAVYRHSALCGVCGFHSFDSVNCSGSVGYWLGARYSGQGLMTAAVRQLVEVGFSEYWLERIEIACATENLKSRAIPERLGFYYEGVIQNREYVDGRYVDHALYSLLAEEVST